PFDDTEALASAVVAPAPAVNAQEVLQFLRTTYRPAPQTLELRARARAGQPPPEPLPRKGQHFILRVEGGRAGFYRWTQLSWQEVESLGRFRPEGPRPLDEAHPEDVHRGKVFLVGRPPFQHVLYGRKRLAPDPQRGGSAVKYFVLTRLPEEGRAVTGADLEDGKQGLDAAGQPAFAFTLTKQGGDHSHEMPSETLPEAEDRARPLAIILDDLVMSSPSLRSPIRQSGMITGKFTPAEVD